ncbi:hypothetical protein AURDEDRAFT_151884 [Auricularia subglabra TFB-10046 SS5]|nr:hypothetical protein AURDEDRAFT_151884 [Auricularia subglabra TFB-10046 SS5]
MAHTTLSAFDAEMAKYIQGLQDKEESEFIHLCGTSGASPEEFNRLIRETHNTMRINTRFSRTIARVADALKDYSEVIGQLATARPLPVAIIWGCVKVAVDGVIRCRDMIDTIGEQFDALAEQIERIKAYKSLYGSSAIMQQLFFRSYRNMIHFWHRAHQECKKSPMEKLNLIVKDIEKDVRAIAAEAAICQAQLDRREHCAARAERVVQSNWRKEQDGATSLNLYSLIRTHLASSSRASEDNKKWHQLRVSCQHPDTCAWLLADETFSTWITADTSSSAAMCLRGQTGCGKTTLTSFAIEHLRLMPLSSVVYYFCQFTSAFESSAGYLHLLAAQLFEVYVSRGYPVSTALSKKVLDSTSNQQLRDLVIEFVDNIDGNIYFLIDGLDEVDDAPDGHNCRNISDAVQMLLDLCDRFGGRVHLWFSIVSHIRPLACYVPFVQRCEGSSMVLDMTGRDERGVERFIHSRVDRIANLIGQNTFHGLSAEDRAALQLAKNALVEQAQANFLWAELMTADFGNPDGPQDTGELHCHVSSGRPPQYDDIYLQHFRKRIAIKDREISSKVMSIITYARRPLSVDELREAVTSLLNKSGAASLKMLKPDAFLHRFSVHVHVDRRELGSIDWSDTCRLDHSSVRDFFAKYPTPWDEGSGSSHNRLAVSPERIALACLSYLQRPIFGTPLKRVSHGDGSWVLDQADAAIPVHAFARYAAKYWARHLEGGGVSEDTSIRRRVVEFITSPNFQTLLQMQMLWVEGQFRIYSVGGHPSVLRVLPNWHIYVSSAGRRSPMTKHWADYSTLHHNWAQFLTCDEWGDSAPDCPLTPSRGEIDRIWWGSLAGDPQHYFARFKARHPSYRLEAPAIELHGGIKYEALLVSGRTIHLLRFSGMSLGDEIAFVYERWAATDYSRAPELAFQQMICCSGGLSSWSLYTKHSLHPGNHLYAPATAFSEDGQVLRVGTAIFTLDSDQQFHPLVVLPSPHAAFPAYLDDITACNGFLALGGRFHSVAAKVLRKADMLDNDMTRLEMWATGRRWKPSIGDDDSSDTSSSSGSDHDWEGYETWSERSTEDESEGSAAAPIVWSGSDSDASDSDHTSDLSESDEYTGSAPYTCDSFDEGRSDSSPIDPTSLPQFKDLDSDDEEVFWGRNMDPRLRSRSPSRGRSDTPPSDLDSDEDSACPSEDVSAADSNSISLTILRMADQSIVFQYKHPLTIMLYDSPPAFHPRESLVVWPLGAGEILFADYAARTYFIRKLRSSAPQTRQISIRPHFSPCGRFLHVASLEAQVCKPDGKVPGPAAGILKQLFTGLRMHVLLSTYRLSTRKTTRSPPDLIHRAKAFVGTRLTITPTQIPFTFTWTDTAVFVTQRERKLTVHRIPLFAPRSTDAAATAELGGVRVPSLEVFLPDNATRRKVYFSPEVDDRPACIVLGSEPRELASVAEATATTTLRGALAPPVLCMIDEKRDLGEWVKAADMPTPTAEGAGNLEHRREKFDPEDDCDAHVNGEPRCRSL